MDPWRRQVCGLFCLSLMACRVASSASRGKPPIRVQFDPIWYPIPARIRCPACRPNFRSNSQVGLWMAPATATWAHSSRIRRDFRLLRSGSTVVGAAASRFPPLSTMSSAAGRKAVAGAFPDGSGLTLPTATRMALAVGVYDTSKPDRARLLHLRTSIATRRAIDGFSITNARRVGGAVFIHAGATSSNSSNHLIYGKPRHASTGGCQPGNGRGSASCNGNDVTSAAAGIAVLCPPASEILPTRLSLPVQHAGAHPHLSTTTRGLRRAVSRPRPLAQWRHDSGGAQLSARPQLYRRQPQQPRRPVGVAHWA